MESNRVQPTGNRTGAVEPGGSDGRRGSRRHHRRHVETPWMERPAQGTSLTPAGCPRGLEYLTQLDQLIIKQQKEKFEVISGFEMQNRYSVQNSTGEQVFFARESSESCVGQCCGPQRSFELFVENSQGVEVLRISRPYKCVCCHQVCSCANCCFDEVSVESPPGTVIGRVVQAFGGCRPVYNIKDESDATVLIAVGPNYTKCYCPGDEIPFALLSQDGTVEVGRVSKQWTNLLQEYFSDADNFGIAFPQDLSVKMKAVVLAACFLIDFMFFEGQNRRSQH